jgi:hypothetical protein
VCGQFIIETNIQDVEEFTTEINLPEPSVTATDDIPIIKPDLTSTETPTTTVEEYTTEINLVLPDLATSPIKASPPATTTTVEETQGEEKRHTSPPTNVEETTTTTSVSIPINPIDMPETVQITIGACPTPFVGDVDLTANAITSSKISPDPTHSMSMDQNNIKPGSISSLGSKGLVDTIDYDDYGSLDGSDESESDPSSPVRVKGRERYPQFGYTNIIKWILGLTSVGIFVTAGIVLSYDRLKKPGMSDLSLITTFERSTLSDLESARNISMNSAFMDAEDFNIEDVIANAELYMAHSGNCDDESSVVSSAF